MLRNLRRYLFVKNPGTLGLWQSALRKTRRWVLERNKLNFPVVDITNTKSCSLFCLSLLYQFCEGYPFVVLWFLFSVSYYINFPFNLGQWSTDSNVVSKIWVGMCTTNIHLQLLKEMLIVCKENQPMHLRRNFLNENFNGDSRK